MVDGLELPGFTIPEAERLLELPQKAGYRLIKEGKIKGFKDVTGKLRIPYGEVYSYLSTNSIDSTNSNSKKGG